MSESGIYEAPKSDLDGAENVSDKDREFFVAIARRQNHLIYTFLGYFVIAVLLGNASDELKPLFQIIGMLLFLTVIIFNMRLCWKLYGAVGRIVMITLGFIPLVNFIVVLVASAKTNRTLKKAGFKVGFMGAKVRDIEK